MKWEQKQWKDLERQRKFKGQYESNIGDKKQSGRCNSEVIGFLRETFEQICEFRSVNLYREKIKGKLEKFISLLWTYLQW